MRSVSGPSGKVQGSAFVLDEVRNRFVHPQDKALVVYFEWLASPGLHVMSAQWKGPDGRTNSLSPEVKVETSSGTLASYWNYTLHPEMAPGIWTVEIRVDGRPGGEHSFEIAGTTIPSAAPTLQPRPKRPTLDEIFRAVAPSVVFVHKLNSTSKRYDTALGFVIAKDRIATAFQGIDGAARLEIEWTDGHKAVADEVLEFSRMADWALLPVETGNVVPIPLGDGKTIAVGERLIAFTVESDAKAIGGIDISGRRNVDPFGERIQFTPAIGLAAAGGPLIDNNGKVVAIIGGSLTPGWRFDGKQMSVNPSLGLATTMINAATPLSLLTGLKAGAPQKLTTLLASGALTPPLSEMEAFVYATTAMEVPKTANAPLPRDVGEFSRRDKQVSVLAEWLKKGKLSKGMLSAKIYDVHNRVSLAVPPKKVALGEAPTRSTFAFAPAGLPAGIYRIDLIWDDKPVWRTLIRVVE